MNTTENTFTNIWYLPSKNTWKDFQVMAMKDIGTLRLYTHGCAYDGDQTNIKIAKIANVTYGKQGRDFINNWVKLEYYDHLNELKEAYFADGNKGGWAGIFGGTKKIYTLIKDMYNL
nr:hypothetical protein [Mucilaginibacter sp. L294]